MTKRPQVGLCLIVVCTALFGNVGGAQTQDPHLPTPRSFATQGQVIQIDDMLLTPDRYAELIAPVQETSRRQANTYGLGVAFGSWDWGVIPYEFAPNFTEVESRNILAAMRGWEAVVPIVFVPKTSQVGHLVVTRDDPLPGSTIGSPCFSDVGQGRGLGQMHRANLGSPCATFINTVYHELGHSIGLHHEHQRADRDSYVTVVFDPAIPSSNTNYRKLTFPLIGPYDLLSIMHYAPSPAITSVAPVSAPLQPGGSRTGTLGDGSECGCPDLQRATGRKRDPDAHRVNANALRSRRHVARHGAPA